MRTISTRRIETSYEMSHIYALRYDYYVVARELDVIADHVNKTMSDGRDAEALHYATYAGSDIVGCFRAEIGAPSDLSFGADWAFGDFLDEMPSEVGLVSGLCLSPYLRDGRVIEHMIGESVAIAKEMELSHVFFEMSPDLWPAFHAAGLSRKGGALPDARTGLQTAVFQLLERRPPVRMLETAPAVEAEVQYGDQSFEDVVARPKLAIVSSGRR